MRWPLLACALTLLLASTVATANAQLAVGAGAACKRPYGEASPWNTPIRGSVAIDPNSAAYVGAIEGRLTSSTSEFSPTVYQTAPRPPITPVSLWGWFSQVGARGSKLVNEYRATVAFPLSAGQLPSQDTGQIVLVNPANGDEWGAFNLGISGGAWIAQNVYHYNTRWSGVPPRSANGGALAGRGSGLTYLGGLIRPCEFARGRIDHALALAIDRTASSYVHPASRSSGTEVAPDALPQGARLQLDPKLNAGDLAFFGCTKTCLVIARALQEYGMIVVDKSGRPKLFAENRRTADWSGRLRDRSPSPIPIRSLRVISLGDAVTPAGPASADPAVRGERVRAQASFLAGAGTTSAAFSVLCSLADAEGFMKVRRAEARRQPDGTVLATCAFDVAAKAKGSVLEGAIELVHARGGGRADFTTPLG